MLYHLLTGSGGSGALVRPNACHRMQVLLNARLMHKLARLLKTIRLGDRASRNKCTNVAMPWYYRTTYGVTASRRSRNKPEVGPAKVLYCIIILQRQPRFVIFYQMYSIQSVVLDYYIAASAMLCDILPDVLNTKCCITLSYYCVNHDE